MKRTITSLLLCVALGTNAQNAFTLQAAIDYALANNATHLNSILDQQLAEMKRNEVRGIGLPQMAANATTQDFINIPTTVFRASAFNPMAPPDMLLTAQMGLQYNSSYGANISQLIFSSDYIVALQASKSYLELSQMNVNRSKVETTVNVSKAYYNVLVSRERAKFIDIQLDRVKKLLDDIKEMNASGFVEKLDVDRTTLAYNNLMAEKQKITRLLELTEYLLKFQMGMTMSEKVVLSDSLMIGDTNVVGNSSKFDYSLRYDYSMLQTQLKLNQLDLKRNKMMWMPTLAAFGSFSENAYRTKFDILAHEKWYPTTLVGVKMSIPIWDGGQTYYKKQQAKLQVERTQNNVKMMESVIDMEIQSSSTSFRNALITLSVQRENIKLAEQVYDVSKTKYDQGVGSILQIIDAESALKEAQVNYYDALYQYHVAKLDFQKANGLIK